MRELIHAAGWPIYLVFAFGAAALIAAARYAARPERGTRLLVAAAAATILAGVVGVTLGLEATLTGLRQIDDPALKTAIFFEGLRESLLSFTTAAVLATVAAVLAMFGAMRLRARFAGGAGVAAPIEP